MRCATCGGEAGTAGGFCPLCGHALVELSATPAPPPVPQPGPATAPPRPPVAAAPALERAGFLRRLVALGLDAVLVAVLWMVVNAAVGHAFERHLGRVVLDPAGRMLETLETRYQLAGWVLSLAVGLLYFSIGERLPRQATPGKRLLGCRVVRSDGSRAGLPRLIWRNLAKLLSAVPCFLGFAMAAVTGSRLALHDLVSGCRVVRR